MPVGFNPYQLAQLANQPRKEIQGQNIKERSTASFGKNYKKKMSDELQAILEKLQADAARRKKKNKGLRKFLDVASIFDPTGLVSGASSYLGAKDMKEGMRLLNTSPSLASNYKNSYLSKGLMDYNKDVTKSWQGINTSEAFAKGTLMDFAGKKIGADGGSNRMKFSDFGDTKDAFMKGYKENNKEGFDFFKNIVAGGKEMATSDGTLDMLSQQFGEDFTLPGSSFKESPLGELVGKYSGAKATKEGEKEFALLLNALGGGDEFSMSGDFKDYFTDNNSRY